MKCLKKSIILSNVWYYIRNWHLKWNKNTYCLNQYYNTCCYIGPCPKQKTKQNHWIRNFMLCAMPLEVLEYAYFAVPSGCPVVTSDRTHTHQACALLLCIRSMFTRITFGSKQVAKWIILQYSNVLQTLVINKIYLKILFESNLVEKLNPDVSQKPVWSSRSLPSSACFQSNCIDCSPRDMIQIRTYTLQTDSLYVTSEINV